MTIEIVEQIAHNIVNIRGDFDAALAPKAREIFSELVSASPKDVVINLNLVPFIDSSGIGAIVFLYKRLRCNNLELTLENLQQQPAELIKLLRIDQIIPTR